MAEEFYLIMPNFVTVSVVPGSMHDQYSPSSDPAMSSAPTSKKSDNTQWTFSKVRESSGSSIIWNQFDLACGGSPHYFNAYTSTNNRVAYFFFQVELNINRGGNFVSKCVLNIAECADGLHSVWWCGAPNLSVRGNHPKDDINGILAVFNTLPGKTNDVLFLQSCGEKATHSITFSA